MAIEANLSEFPGAVEVELGQFRLMPGPQGEPGERGPRGYGIESAVLNEDFTLTLRFEDGSSYTTRSLRGETGPRGETGAEGPVGPKGDQGDVWVPSVTGEGDISWTKNAEEPPQTVNIRGPKGDRGPEGPTGPQGPAGSGTGDMLASTYDPLGKVEDIFAYADRVAGEKAGEAVKDVSAGNVKFEDGQTFQQKLEAGELKGDRGETGPAGPAGKDGEKGAPGPNTVGTDTATDIDGLLRGQNGKVAQAVDGVDYLSPEAADEKYLSRYGGGIDGNLNMEGNLALRGDITMDGTIRDAFLSGVKTERLPSEAGEVANKEYVDQYAVRTDKVVLTVDGWDYILVPGGKVYQQQVEASHVIADEDAQEVRVMPAAEDMDAYMEAGIRCVMQMEGLLRFVYDTAPSKDITVYVNTQMVAQD